jgi:hypothetical protein
MEIWAQIKEQRKAEKMIQKDRIKRKPKVLPKRITFESFEKAAEIMRAQ